jgi:hypothetical protein
LFCEETFGIKSMRFRTSRFTSAISGKVISRSIGVPEASAADVGVELGLGVDAGVAVGEGDDVGVGTGVGVGVGLGEGVGDNSTT